MERDLKGEVVAQKVAVAAQKLEVTDLRVKVDLLMDSTLPGLPVFL
jgi:hypothetical protein